MDQPHVHGPSLASIPSTGVPTESRQCYTKTAGPSLLRKSEKKKGSLLAMWLSPVPLALVGCALELALQPEDVGEEAAGRGLGTFTGLAPQWEISLPVQCLTNSLVQLPLPNSLRTEEEERWTNEYRKQNSFRQKKLQEKQQEAVGFPSAIQLAGLVS